MPETLSAPRTLGGVGTMEEGPSGTEQGAPLVAFVQGGGEAQELRGEAVLRGQWGLELEDSMQEVAVVPREAALGGSEEFWPDVELGRQEEVLAEEVLAEDGGGEAPLLEPGVQEGEWFSGQHFVREQQGLRLEVPVVAACGTLWEGEEVFPDLEPGRQEEVVHGEL